MQTSTIRSIAHALPATVLPYEELERRFGAREVATIAKMSGIRNRRVVANGQCASDLALAAARRLLDHTGVDPSTIGVLLFASQTPDYRIPPTAAILHGRLGLSETCCIFDVNQACSSFLQALGIGHAMVVAGLARRALLLNGDALTTLVNPMDRGLVTLHGDAGAATLVEPINAEQGGIEAITFGADGKQFDKLIVPAGGMRLPSSPETREEHTDASGCTRSLDQLSMDGPTVFHFAMYKVTDFLKSFLRSQGQTIDAYDTVLLHQANKTMIDLIYRALSVPPQKRFYYLEDVGNSSGASLPTVVAQAWRTGVIKPGTRTLLCAFGAGLSWAAASIRWPADADAAVPGALDVPVAQE